MAIAIAYPEPAKVIGPAHTGELDYGRLLQRAYGKGMARPAGLEPATSWFVG